ncbi:hypothetical protein JVU11DRAFT_8277 [Chiua virens]|nr:hypothetical protein JVU11DRAFT_8277 [Chiua virens]
MPPRSLLPSSRRPLSAIFLGPLPPKDPKEANIPDLPEPPESPAISSSGCLPSPPATNSTGSGSTGDNNSANSGSVRQRPVSYSGSPSTMMPSEMSDKLISTTKTSRPNSDDEDDENDHAGEEDHTARLDRRVGLNSPCENIAALQRVKSLAQRNRMALDKLSSRLNTPSPTRTSRSPNAPSSSVSTVSSSRLSFHSHSQSIPQLQRNATLSGSETERESLRAPTPSRSDSDSHSYRSSSPERSSSPPSASSSRPRSPETRQASPGPSRTPRKRVSIASVVSIQDADSGRYNRNDHDVTETALAAVASSRRSPTGKKSRQPLPREFRDRERRSLDGRNSIEPVTPYRASLQDNGYDDHSPRTAMHTAMNATNALQYSPRGARSTRFSTVRDLTRRHQTRWLSEDMSGNVADGGRRQSQRGGSAESVLNGGSGVTGRLAGESLRAAGIGMRGSGRQGAPSNEDVFGEGYDANVSVRAARSSGIGPRNGRTVELQHEERQGRSDTDNKSRTSGSSPRVAEAVALPVRPHLHSDPPRAPTALVTERDARGTGRAILSRPATTMADYLHRENSSRDGSYSIRSRRTTYDLSNRPESRYSPTTRNIPLPQTPSDPDRPGTAILSGRNTSLIPAGDGPLSSPNNPQSAEHTRLMLDSLSMFQTQLSRLPDHSQTARDLADHSAAIIRSSEKLNKILRAATTNAVQQQIAIEINDGYYEMTSLRESDDVVRSLTGFILGVGKLLKEVAGTSDSAHLRSTSLDDEVTRRLPSDPGVERSSSKRSQDGRRSVESRLSWEPMISNGGADVSRRLSSRSDLSLVHPPSSRHRDSASDQDRSASSRNGLGPPSTSRRLFAPREQREQQIATNGLIMRNTSSNVLDLSADYEPSPTPTSRHQPPAYSTPPPLPTLPSESLLQRSNTTVDKGSRRNVSLSSLTSIATLRNPNPPFALSTPNPTTAISIHTASASPELSAFPMQRTDSRDSIRSSVTFSRPSGVSVSALQQQQVRDEARRRVGTADEESATLSQVRAPLSGSETERDTRRRTLGVRAARKSFEINAKEPETGDVSQPRTITFPSQRRERRRTVTEIFG